MIVVEGVDNSGKSTLIKYLRQRSFKGWPVQESEGPPKYPGEQNTRVARYLDYPDAYIFDRHPCVSQPIYGQLRSHADTISSVLIAKFYGRKPFFVYCDPGDRGMTGHVQRNTVDTVAHLESVTNGYHKLLASYREWAIRHAHLIYRIGDDMQRVELSICP